MVVSVCITLLRFGFRKCTTNKCIIIKNINKKHSNFMLKPVGCRNTNVLLLHCIRGEFSLLKGENPVSGSTVSRSTHLASVI